MLSLVPDVSRLTAPGAVRAVHGDEGRAAGVHEAHRDVDEGLDDYEDELLHLDDTDSSVPEEIEELGAEAVEMMTQAKKKRSETTQAREYFRKNVAGKADDRIKRLKARMPCAV